LLFDLGVFNLGNCFNESGYQFFLIKEIDRLENGLDGLALEEWLNEGGQILSDGHAHEC
jgi:hypothetical protein